MSDYHQFGEPSGAGFIDTHFDFKTCARTDGTTYGVPDKSSCAQKGAKEVKGGGDALTQLRAQMAKDPVKFDKDVLSTMDSKSLKALAKKLKGSDDKVDQRIAKLASARAEVIERGENRGSSSMSKEARLDEKLAIANFFSKKGWTIDAEEKAALSSALLRIKQSGATNQKEHTALVNEMFDSKPLRPEVREKVLAMAKEAGMGPKATMTMSQEVDAARKELNDHYEKNKYNLKMKNGVPGPVLRKHYDNQDEVKILEAMQEHRVSYKEAKRVIKLKRGKSDAKVKAKAEDDLRRRQNNARGRSNARLIEAAKNSGCTWEQIKSGNCMM